MQAMPSVVPRLVRNCARSLGINDGERTANALRSIEGKRLTYRPTSCVGARSSV